MKLLQISFITLLGAGLLACSSYYRTGVTTERYKIESGSDTAMDSLIAPYRRQLSAAMGRVIGTTVSDLTVERPNSTMGQWVTDVLFQYGIDSVIGRSDTVLPVIAIFNTGGLRASIAAGPVTVGDIYKVMPFDNAVSAVKLPADRLGKILEYIVAKGGEPVSNFRVANNKAELFGGAGSYDSFWVITSDFLANGGDKMYFFAAPLQRIDSPKLIRDLLLQEVENRKEIDVTREERIRLD